MTSIRERDCRKRGNAAPVWMTQTERDRRALLSAGDALAEAVRCIYRPPYICGTTTVNLPRCANCAALAAWKAATG
jgi:hypothetical protein